MIYFVAQDYEEKNVSVGNLCTQIVCSYIGLTSTKEFKIDYNVYRWMYVYYTKGYLKWKVVYIFIKETIDIKRCLGSYGNQR